MNKMFIEVNQIHNFMSSSGSGTVINYGSGSGFDFLTTSGYGSGSLEPRTAIEGSFSAWGGLGKLDRGLGRGETFFLTAIAIAIATRPFKFHEISVSYTSSSFVSSIHSLV